MNLKLERRVRTPGSEEIVLLDLDQHDAAGAPLSIGKLDVHYTGDGVFGTLLLWPDFASQFSESTLRAFVEGYIVNEITAPMGVSSAYNIEYYRPDMDSYMLFNNMEEEEEHYSA